MLKRFSLMVLTLTIYLCRLNMYRNVNPLLQRITLFVFVTGKIKYSFCTQSCPFWIPAVIKVFFFFLEFPFSKNEEIIYTFQKKKIDLHNNILLIFLLYILERKKREKKSKRERKKDHQRLLFTSSLSCRIEHR